MSDTDPLTWLREVEKAMTPGKWVDGAGDIFAAADLDDGMVRDGECEVASCYGRNRQADEAGIVALRNLAPAMLAVLNAIGPCQIRRRGQWGEVLTIEGGEDAVDALRVAYEALLAAVREEQQRHA